MTEDTMKRKKLTEADVTAESVLCSSGARC
ncbi:Uncharacterised protein [Klebsiella pneumoniae]|uniref:Uncharacterized protein n=1 Tax=Klebsiella pneumoniae TaxID=573 RepID=A0A4P0YH53_KLEPN|nr:Uncharacterised protein [Klebsiella pneumoniae]